jgi:serine/threonine protein kinase/Tol biopolymer transport system component
VEGGKRLAARSWITLREIIFRRMRFLRKLREHFRGLSEQKGSPSRIYWLYQKASDLSGKAREEFLDALRRDDESEYREILSLLETDAPSDVIPKADPLQPLLKPEDMLGRYEILEFIERGGMGEVYKVSHPELGVRVMKILSRELAANAALIDRLRLEAKAAAALNHRNIVTVHDFDQQGHFHYIVMEYVEGQSLRKMIGKLSVREAVDYARQMAEGLSFAHEKGIIHRDIKPENVMVRPDGNIKILDFGLAKPVHLSAEAGVGVAAGFGPAGMKTDPQALMGTLRYMAPEQLDYKGSSAQSDLWALGVTLYEMLAGRRPFEASTEIEVIEAIQKRAPGPPSRYRELNRIVLKALRKNPAERYQSMMDVAEDLRDFVPPSWARRAAVLFLILFISIASWWAINKSKNPELHVDGQYESLTNNSEGHSILPAISPSRKYMVYTEEGVESVLTLVGIVDGASRNPRAIARSLNGKFKGAAFVPNDDQTVFVLLQNTAGEGIIYRLSLSSPEAAGGILNAVSAQVSSTANSKGILLNFPLDKGLCQDKSWIVATLAWYHRAPGGGRFESVCSNPPPDQIDAAASADSPPSFSPDGKYFVFFLVNGKTNLAFLVVAKTEGGEETLIAQENQPYLYPLSLSPLWSRDGKEVLTATWASFDTTLWRTTLKDGKPVGKPKSQHLENLQFRGQPAWLNNGLSIAVSASINGASKSQLTQVPVGGGEPTNMLAYGIGGLDSQTCPQGFFSPNCQQTLIAAVEDDTSYVWIERIGDAAPFRITNKGEYSGITWKDTDSLITESVLKQNPDLLSMNANRFNSSLEPVTDDEQWEKGAVVSPDGRYLVYASNLMGGVHLWRRDLHHPNAKPSRLTSSKKNQSTPDKVENQPSISPTGDWIIFTSITDGFQTLWKVSLKGGEPIQITKNPARNASMSRDGRIVCEYQIQSGPSKWKWIIAILDQNGNVIRSFDDIQNKTPVRWGKEDNSILYVKEQNGVEDVWEKKIQDGGIDTRVSHFEAERILAFALSPDGNRVACLRGHQKYSQIMLMRLAK